MKNFMLNASEAAAQPFTQLVSTRHDFPSEWSRWYHPLAAGGDQVLSMTVGYDRLPFFIQGRPVRIERIDVFAKGSPGASYHLELSYTDRSGASVASTQLTAAPEAAWGNAQTVSIGQTDAGLDLDQLDIEKAIVLKLKRTTATAFTVLGTDPEEFDDVFLVLHYKLDA